MNHLQGFSLWIRTCWTNHALLGALAGKLHYPHQHSCRVVPLPVGSSDEESKWNSSTDFTGITNFVHVPWSSWCFFSLSSLPFPFFCSRHGFYEKVARNWSQKESSWTISSILVSDQPLLSSRTTFPPHHVQALSELLPPSPASQSSPGQWPRVWNPQHPTAHATHRLRTLGHCSLDPCGACFHRQVTSHSLEPETSRNSRVVMPSPN